MSVIIHVVLPTLGGPHTVTITGGMFSPIEADGMDTRCFIGTRVRRALLSNCWRSFFFAFSPD
jgi:hypothetical protein